MHRRAYLAALGTAAVGSLAGCTGGQVLTISPGQTINVPRGRGEVITIPADGDEIRYTARDDQPFATYFFTSGEALGAYQAFLNGEEPEESPAGDRRIGSHTVQVDDGIYEAATPEGKRVPIDADGESYLVIDHSAYRAETVPPSDAGPLSVTVDLSVTASPLPF